jgi:hypothetical protein
LFVTEVALAHAAFGGLLGYFLGRAKLEQEPVWWLPAGLALTALLNGLFNLVRGQLDPGTISRGGPGLPSFNGLLLAGALALLVTLAVAWLVNRDISRSLAARQQAAGVDPTIGDRRSNLAAIGTFAALLIIGALAWANATMRTAGFEAGGVRGAYPAHFGDATGEGDVLRVSDTLGTGAEFAIARLEGTADAEAAAAQLAGLRGTDYEVYTIVDTEPATVAGRSAVRQRFAYVEPGGLTGGTPQLIEGVDYLVSGAGGTTVVTLVSPSEDFAEVEPQFERFVRSLALP